MTSRPLLAALLGLALAACSSTQPAYPPTGPCKPTTQGLPSGAYGDFDTAHTAFARSSACGSFTAVLEDVAWLRFEGCEEDVLKKHRAYFEQGYTTFQVGLFTKDFTQPTNETFMLEDSNGARLSGKPVTYQGTMGQEGDRYAARFSISFRHSLTAELDWLRLTRVADGLSVEWIFREPPPPADGSAPCAVPVARPTNMLRPRTGAPAPVAAATERPVNLLRTPGGPAAAPAAAAPSVGEPAWSGDNGAHSAPAAPAASFPAPAAPPPSVAPLAPGQLPPPAVRTVR